MESVGGFGVRKGTSREIINRLNAVLNDGLRSPAIQARFAELGIVPVLTTPVEFDASLATQTEKWARVIRAANIKPE